MAKKKSTRRPRAKPLAQRFMAEPMKTAKAEWKKLPPVGKAIVALTAVGFTGIGANEIAQSGRIGSAVSPIIAWGQKIRDKLG